MGRKKFTIQNANDARAALAWLWKKLGELPLDKCVAALRDCSPERPDKVQIFVDKWLSAEQAKKLHAAVRQDRCRRRREDKLVTVQLCESAWKLLQDEFIDCWGPSITYLLEKKITGQIFPRQMAQNWQDPANPRPCFTPAQKARIKAYQPAKDAERRLRKQQREEVRKKSLPMRQEQIARVEARTEKRLSTMARRQAEAVDKAVIEALAKAKETQEGQQD